MDSKKKKYSFFSRLRDALQSPPGKFIAALCGGFAIGGVAYQIGRKKGRSDTGRIPGIYGSIDGTGAEHTADTLNDLQQRERKRIGDAIERIAGGFDLIEESYSGHEG